MEIFPSAAWFHRLAERMNAQPEKYRRLGPVDLTLVPRIVFADGRVALFALRFAGIGCAGVEALADEAAVRGPHPVVMEGAYEHWREMIENIQRHGRADLAHTLNALTLPDWPFQLRPLDPDAGQLDVDRFYRYAESLQQLFDEAAEVATRFAADAVAPHETPP